MKFEEMINTIQLGDCYELIKNIPDKSIDLLLTDPPYNLGLFMKSRGTNMGKLRKNHFAVSGWDQLSTAEWVAKMDDFFGAVSRIMKNRGAAIIFMSLIKAQSIIDNAGISASYSSLLDLANTPSWRNDPTALN